MLKKKLLSKTEHTITNYQILLHAGCLFPPSQQLPMSLQFVVPGCLAGGFSFYPRTKEPFMKICIFLYINKYSKFLPGGKGISEITCQAWNSIMKKMSWNHQMAGTDLLSVKCLTPLISDQREWKESVASTCGHHFPTVQSVEATGWLGAGVLWKGIFCITAAVSSDVLLLGFSSSWQNSFSVSSISYIVPTLVGFFCFFFFCLQTSFWKKSSKRGLEWDPGSRPSPHEPGAVAQESSYCNWGVEGVGVGWSEPKCHPWDTWDSVYR